MITFVSAFLDLSEDRTALRSFETYMNHFKKLAETGISIHLFLNKKCTWYTCEYANVHVEYIELEDLRSYVTDACLPSIRTVEKDTVHYLILQNAKPDFVYRAIQKNIFKTSHYYWIDFGIFHVIRDVPKAQAYLAETAKKECRKGLVIPGCPAMHADYFARICWRFCGGVFAGDAESLVTFYETVFCEYADIVKERGLTWEVNLWAYLESQGKICPEWIQADHNDSILHLPESFFL
jgi:hypothetical protein